MSFKSRAQVGYMAKNLPKLFSKWKSKYGIPSNLQQKVSAKKRKIGVASKVLHRARRRIRFARLHK